MSKELIQQLRDLANLRHDDLSIGNEAADALEAQQKRITELTTQRDAAAKQCDEYFTEAAAAQAQRDKLLAALQQMCKAVIADHEAWATSYEYQIAQEAIANVKDDV